MADIELVIKIDEDIYKSRKQKVNNPKRMVDEIELAIANGTPLPKGHGELIDVSQIDKDRLEASNPIIDLTIDDECIEVVKLEYIRNLQPIIKADRSEEE